MAIDKERIVNNLRKSGELTATHLVPPDTANYQPPHASITMEASATAA
jgi:hypothetical protein